MKKSTLAASIIAILGAAWAGGAWFTGKLAESEFERQIAQLNNNALAQGTNMVVQIQDAKLTRGVFSSDVAYNLMLKLQPDEPALVIPMQGKLYHGPLPLDRLSHFDLVPAMFSSQMDVTKNAQTQPWFDAAQGANPFNVVTTVAYNGSAKGDIQAANGQATLNKADWRWQDLSVHYDVDKQGFGDVDYQIGKLQADFDEEATQIAVRDAESPLKTMAIHLEKVKGQSQIQRTDFERLFVGKQEVMAQNLTAHYTYKERMPNVDFTIDKLNVELTSELKDQFADYQFKFNADKMQLNKVDFGALNWNLKASHLDAETLSQLGVAYEQNNQRALTKGGEKLLKNQPHFEIKPLKLSNQGGQFEGNFDLELANGDFVKVLGGKPLSLFKTLTLTLKSDKAALTSLTSAVEQLGGTPKEDADNLAQEAMTEMIDTLKPQNLLVEEESAVKSELILENGELKLNGTVIPEKEITSLIIGALIQAD